MHDPTDPWPALDASSWAPTRKSLHLYAQMLGKLRLALSPHQPNFLFTALALTPRGFTTGLIPYDGRSIQVSVDVFSVEMTFESSDGARRSIALSEPCTVAHVFSELHGALAAAGVAASLSPIPQEIADRTPLDVDRRPALFDPLEARRWHRAMISISGALDRWRSHFAGRMGLYLWWGALDFSLLLFSGEHAEAPGDRGYLPKYELDTEMMNVGFYLGDDAGPPIFYGYIFPQPDGCESLPILPAAAEWSNQAKEWILPYEAVRSSMNPDGMLASFLDSIYSACSYAAGWERDRFRYIPPPLRRAK